MKLKFVKAMSALSAVSIAASLISVPAFAADTVYEITNPSELAALAGKEITGEINLRSNIDMAGTAMTPIASFDGIFNGNGYKISNLTITAELKDNLTYSDPTQGVGLFSTFSGNASNIIFESPSITLSSGERSGAAVLAGTVASDKITSVENCAVVGGSVDDKSAKTTYEGAFVGFVTNAEKLSFKNCFSTAEIKYSGTNPNYNYAGGFVGQSAYTELVFENSAVLGNVTGSGKNGFAGGFVGLNNGKKDISFKNCYVSGKISASTANAYIYGGSRYSKPNITVTNSYYDNSKNDKIDCFTSYVNLTGSVVGTSDFTSLNLGDGFETKDGYPLPKWYTSPAEPAEKKYKIIFNITPSTAKLSLYDNNEEVKSTDNSFLLTEGTYTYEISDFGYVTQTGSITVSENKTVDITLTESTKYALSFDIRPSAAKAEITVSLANGDNRIMQGQNGIYSLPEGVYNYTVSAEGYKSKSGTFSVPDTDKIPLTLAAGNSWSGELSETLEGNGILENPYKIKSGNDLAYMAKQVNDGGVYASASYILENDIDLGYQSWTPIGKTSVAPFYGTFDGQGHKITGLNVSDESVYAYYGLFGCLKDASVKNITVCGEIFSSETTGYIGGIAGAASGNTTIEKCVNAATVSAKAGVSAGGLVGLCKKSDDIGYEWIDNTVKFIGCVNRGTILITGENKDYFSEGRVGGIVGYSRNCVQFEDCANIADISGANIAAGICGNSGNAQGDGCHPYFKNCYNAGSVSGKLGTYQIVGDESISEEYVSDCYAVTSDKYATEKTTDEMKSDLFTALLNESKWQRTDEINNGYPYPTGTNIPNNTDALSKEALKYNDILSIASDAKEGNVYELIKQGETPSPDVDVRCGTAGENIIGLSGGKIKFAAKNTSGKSITVNAVLIFENDEGRLRKNITVVINPEASARQSVMNKLAEIYASKTAPDEWVVFDMAAYKALNISDKEISEAALQNYINTAIDGLTKSYATSTDRAKAEIIMSVAGIDTTKLYPVNSNTPINNAKLLRENVFGSDYTSAIWALLADKQGNVRFTDAQLENLVDILISNQDENGIFSYKYGLYSFSDVDSVGWALAALAEFTLSENSTLKSKAQAFTDKAIAGLSAELGENGSYGNINSDAMVITGLLALGIDPSTDERFIKNGCSLADALMLYVNENGDGFISAYASGDYGESLTAMATEQGFRSLVAMEAFEKNSKKPYNIYAFNITSEEQPPKNTIHATGTGSIEMPEEPSESAENITVNVEIKALDKTWINSTAEIKEGSTVYHLLKNTAAKNDITTDGIEKGYIKAMTYKGETLAEFDKGEASGWLYYVNDELPNVGIIDYVLNDGDTVRFVYTADYTKETSGSLGGGGYTSSKDSKTETTVPADTITPSETAWVNSFKDVKADDWFYSAIEYVCKNNLFKGISEEEFAPNENLTRAMFVTVLYRAENEPETSSSVFEDIAEGVWYEKAVSWACANNIVSGISENEFAPDEEITREQMSAIMYRYAKMKGFDLSAEENTTLSFEDKNDISEYALNAVTWCVGANIMSGRSSSEFAPQDTATRAEAAAVLMRLLNIQ